MPSFNYRATNIEGQVTEGSIEAIEESVVVKKLQDLGYIPIRISPEEEIEKPALDSSFSFFQRITRQEVLTFTQELSSLQKAGIPLDRSFKILIKMSEKKKLIEVLEDILNDVVGGAALADAMGRHPKVFSRLYVSMVRSGESSGALDTTLERLAEFLERSQELRGDILSAMIYPSLLTLVSGASIIILLIFVIPKFASTFSDLGVPLPLPTAILLDISQTVSDHWLAGLLLVIFSAILFRYYIHTPAGSMVWDNLKLKLPILGTLMQRIEMARFSRTFGTILKGGVPILQSLRISKEVVSNRIIANAIQELHEKVKKGERVGDSLREKEFIPSLAVEMISVGEETGRLNEMLLDVADTFDKQVKERLKRLLSILEPGLILIMGVIVGTIVVSMLMAIFSINDMPF